MSPLLEMRSITKEYRGVAAVEDVSFALETGEIHALVGENGAGKSTLTKIIAGAVTPTSGTMLLDGKPIVFAVPKDALHAGIAMVYQENSPGSGVDRRPEHLSRPGALFQPHARDQHRRTAISAVAEFRRGPDRFGRLARRCPAPDGGDRASGSPASPHHHLRRTDSLADAGREISLLRPDEAAEAERRLNHLHQSRARGGAAECRSHHGAARRQARTDGRRRQTRPYRGYPGDGRAQSVRRDLWRPCREQGGTGARAQGVERAKSLNGIAWCAIRRFRSSPAR